MNVRAEARALRPRTLPALALPTPSAPWRAVLQTAAVLILATFAAHRLGLLQRLWVDLANPSALALTAILGVGLIVLGRRQSVARRQYVAALAHCAGLEKALDTVQDALDAARESTAHATRLAPVSQMMVGIAEQLRGPVGSALAALTRAQRALEEQQDGRIDGLEPAVGIDHFLALQSHQNQRAIESLLRCSSQIQSFQRLAERPTTQERRPFALHEVVDEVLRASEPAARKAGHQLRVALAPGLRLDGFPAALSQALMHLVDNGVRHAFAGGRRGIVTVAAEERGGEIALTVADDGVGIGEETLPRLYDPSYSTCDRTAGGLGLLTVHHLVAEVMGGRLRVESARGAGSRFEMVLPRVMRGAEWRRGDGLR
jgi:two-component system NtrC family sensor kinase